MTTVRDLLPGDLVTSATARVFISSCPHPVWHHLLLVVWRREDGTIRLDALGPDEEVGDVQPIEPAARAERLGEVMAEMKCPARVVHYHWPAACGCGDDPGSLWSGDLDRVTCESCKAVAA